VENLLAPGRRRRFLNGTVLALAALGVAVGLVMFSAPAAWFAIVFVLAWLAALMLVQARDRT
jgi:hypothetical protein